MATILGKRQYAESLGVTPSAISKLIARGKLSGGALTADGKINVAAANAQIRITVEPVMQAGAIARAKPRGRPQSAPPQPADETNEDRLAWVADQLASRQLLRARALSAAVDAERKRRELQHECGRYMLTSDAEARWTRILTAFLHQVDASFPDLVSALRNDRTAPLLVLRKWWRTQRQMAADLNQAVAGAEPEFVGDQHSGV